MYSAASDPEELPLPDAAIADGMAGMVGYNRDWFGAWLSLVERPLWERNVAGSNPVAPTIFFLTSPA